MPFYKEIKNENARVLLWKYDVNDVFDESILIEPENRSKFETIHPIKRIEYLMVRQLKSLELPHHKILYHKEGQPYLSPNDAYISVSHSYPFAGISISRTRVGIDLEQVQERIVAIQHKFLHPTEYLWIDDSARVEYLTIIWAVKEALYKLHPSKYWSFKKHYKIDPFILENLAEIKCCVFDDTFKDYFVAKVIKIEDYYLAMIS